MSANNSLILTCYNGTANVTLSTDAVQELNRVVSAARSWSWIPITVVAISVCLIVCLIVCTIACGPRNPTDNVTDVHPCTIAIIVLIVGFWFFGNIVSAAINGCIIASYRREKVAMRHIVEAIARELIKMGKQVSPVHFGEYYEFVQGL